MENPLTQQIMQPGADELALNAQVAVYQGASMLKITPEEQQKLTAPIDERIVEIRPDGLIYLPQAFVRRLLNDAFGIGQWCVIRKEVKIDEASSKVYYDGILHIRGCYVSHATGEAEYHIDNAKQSWASVVEAAKSDCIVRCCKDLGIASELWQPQFSRHWVAKYAVKVFVEIRGTKKVQWRRKDVEPYWNETGIVPGQPGEAVPPKQQPVPAVVPQSECSNGEAFNITWTPRLAACKTKDELMKLYTENKEDVDASPGIQELFKQRQNVLNRKRSKPQSSETSAY